MAITKLDTILKEAGWIKYSFLSDNNAFPPTSEIPQTLTKNNIPYLLIKDPEVVLPDTTSLYIRTKELDATHRLFRTSKWTGD